MSKHSKASRQIGGRMKREAKIRWRRFKVLSKKSQPLHDGPVEYGELTTVKQ